MDEKLILIVPFILGAAVGSFLNVCIHRIPLSISIVSPPSSCPGCGRHIPFYYNIPIISYIILLGRCAYCKNPISVKYPLVESVTAVFAVFIAIRFGMSLEALVYFIFISALIVITFIDLKYQIIPDCISIPGIPLGFILSFALPSPGVLNSAIGILLGGGILFSIACAYYWVTGNEGMGGGDIKLLAMIGALLGWKGVVMTLLAGSFTGAAAGVSFMVIYGKSGKYAIPFGPFLALGASVYLFFGDAIITWYIDRALTL